MLIADVVAASQDITATPSRTTKTQRLAVLLRQAAPADAELAVAYLSGEPAQRRTGVGWAGLRDFPEPATDSSLTLLDVDACLSDLSAVSGAGSAARRATLLDALLRAATATEQTFLRALLLGELRQGASTALVVGALAAAHEVPEPDVRRAVMMQGAVGPVARALAESGATGLAGFGLVLGRPVHPMLASPGGSLTAAMARGGLQAVEEKLDGIRVQAHKWQGGVALFTRTLDDVTARLPEVVDVVAALPAESVVLDGEVLALRPDGRPRPFQQTAVRIGSRVDIAAARAAVPLSVSFFDLLHLDGRDTISMPADERAALLAGVVPAAHRVRRLVTDDLAEAQRFTDDALARGHEGVVVKDVTAPYDAGRRGAAWQKVKPVHSLDLVVLAVEWGSGRRRGWLSNLHLGARADAVEDPTSPVGSPTFVMLGKTFKGLTDAMLAWQTEALQALAVEEHAWGIDVRPELVVEIAFDGVQTSSRYPGGMALRFARVLRHRPDKPASDADTVSSVRALHVT